MAFSDTLRETFSLRPQRGELIPHGKLDQYAGVGLVASAVLYIYFNALGGPIRGLLGPLGLAPLIYLPALIGIPSLLANTLARVGDTRTSAATLSVLAFLAIEVVIAKFLGRPLKSIFFQLYIFTAALVMMAATQRGLHDRIIKTMIPLFFITVVGIFLNTLISFPWADSAYEFMGSQRGNTREWSAGGRSRLAGFTRASTDAAAIVLISYCVLEAKLKSLPMKAGFWLIGLVAIDFTTSKSPELAMLLLPATYFAIGRIRTTGEARRRDFATLLMAFWLALIFLGPLISLTYGTQLYPAGVGEGRSYSSLADRVLRTWPNAINLVDWHNPVSWLVGRGLGGIGAPMLFYDEGNYNTADNFAIYMIVTFGLGAIAVAYLIFRGGVRSIQAGRRGRRDFAMIVALLGIGSAANVVEGLFPMIVLGLALAKRAPWPSAIVNRGTRRSHRRRRSSSQDRQEVASY